MADWFRDSNPPMACDLGECDHVGVCYPDPDRESRGWCPYCERPVYGDQTFTMEHRTNGVTIQTVPVHARCKPCSRCGGDPNWCPCTTGWSSTRGMRW